MPTVKIPDRRRWTRSPYVVGRPKRWNFTRLVASRTVHDFMRFSPCFLRFNSVKAHPKYTVCKYNGPPPPGLGGAHGGTDSYGLETSFSKGAAADRGWKQGHKDGFRRKRAIRQRESTLS